MPCGILHRKQGGRSLHGCTTEPMSHGTTTHQLARRKMLPNSDTVKRKIIRDVKIAVELKSRSTIAAVPPPVPADLEGHCKRCRCSCCCGCCGCCSGCSGKVEDNVQVVAFSSLRFPLLPFLPFSSCDPFCLARLPARLSWLLATLFDGLAPSVGVGRCPYGPTRRFSTMSCVYSTHPSLRALNSFPSSLQRISLALPPLFFFVPSCPSWA